MSNTPSMDIERFSRIVSDYRRPALSLALRMLKNTEDAEDAVQEAFVKAFANIHTFRGDAQENTWLYRIVYTTCLNVLRKNRALSTMSPELYDEEFVMITDDIVGRINEQDLRTRVEEILSTMPSLYAAVLDLFYLKEFGYDDIVAVTGLPLGTVKTRLNRGRGLLREALKDFKTDIEEEVARGE